jgi:hypothetical protein
VHAPPISAGERCPRRLILLCEGEQSPAEAVLVEYHGKDIVGSRLHADLQRCAEEYPGRVVAAEWEGPLGWTRFMWCMKERGSNAP